MSEQEIEAHNARTLWADVANHLLIARNAIEQAQSSLEDLHAPDIAERLTPVAESVGDFYVVADRKRREATS